MLYSYRYPPTIDVIMHQISSSAGAPPNSHAGDWGAPQRPKLSSWLGPPARRGGWAKVCPGRHSPSRRHCLRYLFIAWFLFSSISFCELCANRVADLQPVAQWTPSLSMHPPLQRHFVRHVQSCNLSRPVFFQRWQWRTKHPLSHGFSFTHSPLINHYCLHPHNLRLLHLHAAWRSSKILLQALSPSRDTETHGSHTSVLITVPMSAGKRN